DDDDVAAGAVAEVHGAVVDEDRVRAELVLGDGVDRVLARAERAAHHLAELVRVARPVETRLVRREQRRFVESRGEEPRRAGFGAIKSWLPPSASRWNAAVEASWMSYATQRPMLRIPTTPSSSNASSLDRNGPLGTGCRSAGKLTVSVAASSVSASAGTRAY